MIGVPFRPMCMNIIVIVVPLVLAVYMKIIFSVVPFEAETHCVMRQLTMVFDGLKGEPEGTTC